MVPFDDEIVEAVIALLLAPLTGLAKVIAKGVVHIPAEYYRDSFAKRGSHDLQAGGGGNHS
jgi:hypothetical protein